MNALVARYSQPTYRSEAYSQEDDQELYQRTPSISLKFTLPPLANVSFMDRL
jgi:20S proteasome subunit beta 5